MYRTYELNFRKQHKIFSFRYIIVICSFVSKKNWSILMWAHMCNMCMYKSTIFGEYTEIACDLLWTWKIYYTYVCWTLAQCVNCVTNANTYKMYELRKHTMKQMQAWQWYIHNERTETYESEFPTVTAIKTSMTMMVMIMMLKKTIIFGISMIAIAY